MRHIVSLRWVGVLVAGALLLPGTTYAQRDQGPCKEDVDKFCAEAQRGAVGKCLREHEAELSSACREQISKMRKKVKSLQESCDEDLQKFCSSVQPGGGRVLRCLDGNYDRLSETCQQSLTATKEEVQRRRRGRTN